MILYFSGTGNSEYVAKRLAKATDDLCINLFEKLKNKDYREINSNRPFVIVAPTYGWRIPRLLSNWLIKTNLTGSKDIYFVMTCGGEIGNAAKYLIKLCEELKLNFKGCTEIVMPENYIAMFGAPEKEEAIEIIEKSEPAIDETADRIAKGERLNSKKVGIVDKLKSSIVNDMYYPVCLHAKKFTVDNKCISCGKCEKGCVLNNIKIVNGRPVWGDNCTHCMACICRCPAGAIEYGTKSIGQPRYTCPK